MQNPQSISPRVQSIDSQHDAAGGFAVLTQYEEHWLRADDSTRILVREYRPEQRPASRALVIVHGVCEHGGRYDHIARMFVGQGWNVLIPDLRGHGYSDGAPSHIKSFRRYASDLELVHNHFELTEERTAMIGHSMGGLVCLRFAQLKPNRVSAMVLSSPLLAIKVPIPRATIAAGRLMALMAPQTRFRSRVNPADTTRSPQVLEKRLNDPLIHRSVTAGWFFAMRAALQAGWKGADKVQVPLLIMQAGADRIVCPEAPAQWLKRVASTDKTFHSLPGQLHEVLNEPEWELTATQIADWLEQRIVQQDESHAEVGATG